MQTLKKGSKKSTSRLMPKLNKKIILSETHIKRNKPTQKKLLQVTVKEEHGLI
jgi:hypothetical protein